MNNIERSPERRIENMPRGILERVGGFMKGTLKWALILTGLAAIGGAVAHGAGWTQKAAENWGAIGQGVDAFGKGSHDMFRGLGNTVTSAGQRGWEHLQNFWTPSPGPGPGPVMPPAPE